MAVLEVPFHSPWFFSRWAFRILLERGIERVGEGREDVYRLQQAIALDGLFIESLEVAQEARLARAVGRAAAELEAEWRGKENADQRDEEFRDLLAEIALVLRADDHG